jgi:hypothetical protein
LSVDPILLEPVVCRGERHVAEVRGDERKRTVERRVVRNEIVNHLVGDSPTVESLRMESPPESDPVFAVVSTVLVPDLIDVERVVRSTATHDLGVARAFVPTATDGLVELREIGRLADPPDQTVALCSGHLLLKVGY